MTFQKMLFVCLGNSCSSPMAEAIMKSLMEKTSLYWEVDSAAMRSWNIGRRPHKRCMRVLKEHGLSSDHYCRLLSLQDFLYFDFIVAMDAQVYTELLAWVKLNRGVSARCIHLLSWYGKHERPMAIHKLSPTCKLRIFRSAYYQIKQCCKQFIVRQQVEIIQYKLPSTEEDLDEQTAPATPQLSPVQSDSKLSLMSDLQSMASVNKQLCRRCGKKYTSQLLALQ